MKLKQIQLILPLALFSALAVGCQTNEIKEFSKLQPGMEKGDVVGIMGSPRRSERRHGADRWTYIFYQDNQRYEKEVQFHEGKSFYIGDVSQPEVSAEEQDKRNEASNQELQAAFDAKREANRQSTSKYHGYDASQGSNQIRYVPEFKPVQ